MMNQSRYFLPHLLALSTSSPFWHGRETGLKSYRTIILGNLPRAALPPSFTSWAEYERFVDADRHGLHRRADQDLVGHPAQAEVTRPSSSVSPTSARGSTR